MTTKGTQFDVTPSGIARRNMQRKISAIVWDMIENDNSVFTDVDGRYNDVMDRVIDVLNKHLLGE